jgi:Ran GTPase-activating protein (RanGAP) involved in mRNA processing and transport
LFASIDIASGQMILVEQVLQHSTSLQVLNLASNMLSDSDISSLLKVVNKGLSELDLSNNLVSAAILSSLTGFRLRILNLSHNPLGPLMFEKLPAFLDLIPSLKHLLLENTDIGKVFVINDRTRQVYIDQGKKGNDNVCIKIR